MNTFDNVSGQYKEKAVIQQTAASNLLFLIKIGKTDNIIDIACGPGHITNRLKKVTSGKVTGIDISEGMICQAKNLYPGINFRQIAAEELDYKNEFDIAFCNSSLMWFVNPGKAIKGICNALKFGGRLALACPATSAWSPWFMRIISGVTASGDIKPIFSHWKSPWFFLPAKEDNQLFFEKQGFKKEYIEIKHEITNYSIEEAYNRPSTNIAVTNRHIKLESWNSPNSPNDFIWYFKGGEIAVNNREDQEIAILTLHLLQIFMVNVNTLLVQKESTVASYN